MNTDRFVDLHVHSTYSDGTYTPSELVTHALEKGLCAFALTDHDTVKGIPEAVAAAAGTPLCIIPGVELSTEYKGRDIHILGLFVDSSTPSFSSYLYRFVHAREIRNEEMAHKLTGAGFDISIEQLTSAFPDAVLTRSHFARFMLDAGYVSSSKEAFERYIGDHSPYFVPRKKISPLEAIDVIKQSGGLSILAHPPLYKMSDNRLDELTADLSAAGLNGIEAIYTTYHTAEENHMKRLAKKYGLLLSGGSDFHGSNKPKTHLATGYGSLFVPESILNTLEEERSRLFPPLPEAPSGL